MARQAEERWRLVVLVHLRNPLGADKACRLHDTQASVRKAVDEFDLDVGGDDLLLVLEAISWADFNDFDKVGGGSCRCKSGGGSGGSDREGDKRARLSQTASNEHLWKRERRRKSEELVTSPQGN